MGLTTQALMAIAERLPLETKRLTGRNGGIEGWYPYYAGFSEQFARTVLEGCNLAAKSTVLDPWNGSGTTTQVADRLGLSGLGLDINPVACLVANARLTRPRDAEHVLGLASRIADAALAKHSGSYAGNDSLVPWLPVAVVSHYRAIERAVLADLGTNLRGISTKPLAGNVPPLASFLLLALMRAARSLASLRPTTNPTWVHPGVKRRGRRAALTRSWIGFIEQMADDLGGGGITFPTSSEATLADARQMPISDETVDFVLTSPPYCTRIDYVVNTSFELAAMGLARSVPQFSDLRRVCMGTPLARTGRPQKPPTSWPLSLQQLLRKIRSHPSKASNSYYYKTFWQYFSDCDASLREIHRCLRFDAAAVIVVQSSYYKELYVDLAELYSDLGRIIGFEPTTISTSNVSRVLAKINSRSTRYRGATSYTESVLVLEKHHGN